MITQLIIYSNCSISDIIETWLTIDDYSLAYQQTPDGIKVLLVNNDTSHRRGGLSLLFSSKLKLMSSLTTCFSSYEILIYNIRFPSFFTIIIILIHRPPSSSLWCFLADLSSILESLTSVKQGYSW